MAATEDEGYMTFEEWATAYNKKYDSQNVRDERKTLWEQNLEFVKQHNAQFLAGKQSYRVQQTRCSDQTLEELSWMSCKMQPIPAGAIAGAGGDGDPNPGDPHGSVVLEVEPNPESVDWRERGFVTPVRDQGPLPASWIFAAVSAVESHNAKTNGELVVLSVQQLVDCIFGGDRDGSVERALDYIAVHGSISEKDYPQSKPFKKGHECLAQGREVAVELDLLRYVYVGNSEKDLETAVAHKGPVAVTLTFFNRAQLTKFGQLKTEDVFYDPNPEGVKDEKFHSVLVIGYGSQQNKEKNGIEKFWLIKNSWGHNERYSGFQKIAKDRGNHCNIALCPIYPLVRTHQAVA